MANTTNHVVCSESTPPPSPTTTISTTTTIATSSESPDIQQIDVDVFEAPDKFQDISEPFDNLAFEDISSSGAQKLSELDEIQLAIREAFGKTPQEVKKALINVGGSVITTISPVRLEEVIGMSTTRKRSVEDSEAVQMDGAPIHVKMDQSTPPAAPTTSESKAPEVPTSTTTQSSTTAAPRAHLDSDLLEPSKSLISTFGSPPGLQNPRTKSPIRPQIATEWRKKLISESSEASEASEDQDPFELRTTTVTTSTTPLPLHILPKSTFHSSGSNPDALPAFNLFRYPDHVQIPFFGATQNPRILEPPKIERPTTPEPSGEVQEDEEEVEVPMSEVEDKESEYDAGDSESEDVEEITASEADKQNLITTTVIPIDKNDDYVEETFSKETDKIQNFDDAILKSNQIPESFGIGKAPDSFPEDTSEDVGIQSLGSFAIGKAPEAPTPLEAVEGLLEASGPSGPPGSSFGIGRSPPGSSGILETSGASRPATFGSKNAPKEFPTLISQEVEKFFASSESGVPKDSESESSSSLGSFGSAEQVMNIPVQQHLEILDDPTTTVKPKSPKPKSLKPKSPKPIGIFETQKLSVINQKAYHPPMFPSPLSSEVIQMPTPYYQRTTIPPIGPHGLAEKPTDNVINSVDMELPALGMGCGIK